jgi:hypothetical protein
MVMAGALVTQDNRVENAAAQEQADMAAMDILMCVVSMYALTSSMSH